MHTSLLLAPALALLAAPRQEDVPAEVREWITTNAMPLDTLDPGWGGEDLEPVAAAIGDAPLVLVGEATHGSREFFRFKHRLLECLVTGHGFTDFVMETDWVGARVAGAYVETGAGDLDGALKALGGLWRTAEYRDLLVWMREWNANPAHATKVRLHGMDMQQPGPIAVRHVLDFLGRVDPDLAADLTPLVERIGNRAPVEQADLDGILSVFDDLHDDMAAATSALETAVARQHLSVLIQTDLQAQKRGNDATAWRDECMAANVLWIHATYGGRQLVSAHNGHVSRAGLFEDPATGTVQSIGRALAANAEAPAIVVLGTAFGHGAFWAMNAAGGGLTEFSVEAPLPGSLEVALAATLERPSVLDLRTLPSDGPARAFFAQRRPAALIGGAWGADWFTDPARALSNAAAEQYDLLLFVPAVTAAVRE